MIFQVILQSDHIGPESWFSTSLLSSVFLPWHENKSRKRARQCVSCACVPCRSVGGVYKARLSLETRRSPRARVIARRFWSICVSFRVIRIISYHESLLSVTWAKERHGVLSMHESLTFDSEKHFLRKQRQNESSVRPWFPEGPLSKRSLELGFEVMLFWCAISTNAKG